jgi:hypothetical protein
MQESGRDARLRLPQPCLHLRGITDDTVHALVGYGTHNGIQRFKCQSCGKVFTYRFGTPLYYLKTDPKQVERVLWFLAEGVDTSVMIRFTGHCDATLSRWLTRMGCHSQLWHHRFFRDLTFTLLQIDELYTRVRSIASARWLWLAIDPVSKAMPTLHLGGRTKDDAFTVAHDLKLRFAPDCVPTFTNDGLCSYFYALTAHFGTWFRPLAHARITGRSATRCITPCSSNASTNAAGPCPTPAWRTASAASSTPDSVRSGCTNSFRPPLSSASTSSQARHSPRVTA